MLPAVWGALGIATVVAAILSRHSRRALFAGRYIVATLYIAAGALVNLVFVIRGDDYAEFAESSYIPFVRDTWASLVVPNVEVFIAVLIVFEAVVGVCVLLGKRATQAAYLAAIAFHVALMSFGFGFFIWSIPMIVALVTLLRGERRRESEKESPAVLRIVRAA